MTARGLACGLIVALVGAGAAFGQARPPAAQPPAQGRPQQAPAQAPAQSQPVNPLVGAGGTGPLVIDSDRLEVRDREKLAIFTGNVVATRGEAMVRASVMTVFYESNEQQPGGTPAPTPPPAAPAGGPQSQGQQIRRIEMTGPVFFCQRTQTARGDRAVYERANETLVMTGNVVLTDGPENVVTGPRLIVNLRNNQAQVTTDPAQPGVRIRSQLGGANQPAQPAPRPTRPGQPAQQRPC